MQPVPCAAAMIIESYKENPYRSATSTPLSWILSVTGCVTHAALIGL